MFCQGFLALPGSLPSDPGILLVDSEKQDLMGEEMEKCEGVSTHRRSFYTTPKPSAIFLLVPQLLFAENRFVALFWAFSKSKELVVK